MRHVLVGYGDYTGWRLSEVPDNILTELAKRFPLNTGRCEEFKQDDLFVVVAVHEELARRSAGGLPQKRVPPTKDLAKEIIGKGFRELSKVHHPDRSGEPAIQVRLTAARDQLLKMAESIGPDYREREVVMIPRPLTSSKPRVAAFDPNDYGQGITEDDIPF